MSRFGNTTSWILLTNFDTKDGTSSLSNEELEQRKADRDEVAKVILMHEISWR